MNQRVTQIAGPLINACQTVGTHAETAPGYASYHHQNLTSFRLRINLPSPLPLPSTPLIALTFLRNTIGFNEHLRSGISRVPRTKCNARAIRQRERDKWTVRVEERSWHGRDSGTAPCELDLRYVTYLCSKYVTSVTRAPPPTCTAFSHSRVNALHVPTYTYHIRTSDFRVNGNCN